MDSLDGKRDDNCNGLSNEESDLDDDVIGNNPLLERTYALPIITEQNEPNLPYGDNHNLDPAAEGCFYSVFSAFH